MRETQTEDKKKGLASLFEDCEIKDFFRRYVQLLVTVEVLIFLVCWVYQLGIDEVAATGAVVDIPFPWKMYFTVSFIAPIAVTFLTNIVIATVFRRCGCCVRSRTAMARRRRSASLKWLRAG